MNISGPALPAAALLLVSIATAAPAQIDTARTPRLDAVVVTADRIASSIASTTASVSSLDSRVLRSYPLRTVADALRLVPGAALVDFDGLALDPQIMMRGFYGGGEAEYVLLLLDGRPLNQVENGRVTWDQIPLSAIESVEIVRGGASAVWGDAALAGVINLRTRSPGMRLTTGAIEGGSFGELRASASSVTSWQDHPASLFGNFASTDGFREHSARRTGGFGARLGVIHGGALELAISTSHDWRDVDDPGPLLDSELAESRSQSSPFYRFDRTGERTHRASLDVTSTSDGDNRFTGQLNVEYRRSDRTRTLRLAPVAAETKNRVLGATRVSAAAQYQMDGVLDGDDDLLLGMEASAGGLRSRYYSFMIGVAPQYEGADAGMSRGDLETTGDGMRSALAGFLVYGRGLTGTLRLTAGARLDWLHDDFDAVDFAVAAAYSATHVAFSPRLGLNWNYSSGQRRPGNLYLNVGRSFKAPTQDQLFDQRYVTVGEDGSMITFANRGLNPQFGVSYEAGLYQTLPLAGEALAADVTLSLYQMDMKDEVDFDIGTFSYQNVGRSRHRGLETGVTLHGPYSLRVYGNYSLQDVTSRTGANTGKYLKAIPRHTTSAGLSVGGGSGLAASVGVTNLSGMYLDDSNENRLPSWTRWDLRASYAVAGVRLFADVLNVLDSSYNTTGFPDPAGTGAVYLYPAAGRGLRLGVSR